MGGYEMTSTTHCKSRALAGLALGTTAPAAPMALPDAADPDLGAPQPLPSFVEDELHHLIPFVSDGDTSIEVSTISPGNDDNVLFTYLFTGPS